MNYILIYDKVKHIDITLLDNFPFIVFIILGIITFSILEKEKEFFIKLIVIFSFIIICAWITIDGWLESNKIIEKINNKQYSVVEGEIYNYIPSNNRARDVGSFFVDNHKFISKTPYGFTSDLYLNNIILKNRYKVKVYYIGNTILKLWLENPIPILETSCTNGSSEACYELFYNYENGIFVKYNREKSKEYYLKSEQLRMLSCPTVQTDSTNKK